MLFYMFTIHSPDWDFLIIFEIQYIATHFGQIHYINRVRLVDTYEKRAVFLRHLIHEIIQSYGMAYRFFTLPMDVDITSVTLYPHYSIVCHQFTFFLSRKNEHPVQK